MYVCVDLTALTNQSHLSVDYLFFFHSAISSRVHEANIDIFNGRRNAG
jgi:hypothetical protein